MSARKVLRAVSRWVRPASIFAHSLAGMMRGNRSAGMICSVALPGAVDGEGDALQQERALQRALPLSPSSSASRLAMRILQQFVVRPDCAAGRTHLVVGAPRQVGGLSQRQDIFQSRVFRCTCTLFELMDSGRPSIISAVRRPAWQAGANSPCLAARASARPSFCASFGCWREARSIAASVSGRLAVGPGPARNVLGATPPRRLNPGVSS